MISRKTTKNRTAEKSGKKNKKGLNRNIFFIVVSFLFVAVLIGAHYQKPVREKISGHYFTEGEKYFNNKEYDLKKAEAFYRRALLFDSNFSSAHYQLARVYFVQNKLDAAKIEIDRALTASPGNTRSYYIRGLIDGHAKRHDEAIADFEKFVEWAPKEWAGYNDLAWAYYENGNYEKARETAEKGLTVAPDNAWLLNGLGVSLLALGEYDQSEEILAKAKEASEGMTPGKWRASYPGNDPDEAGRNLEKFKNDVDFNGKLAMAWMPDGAAFIPACNSSTYHYCEGCECAEKTCDTDHYHLGDGFWLSGDNGKNLNGECACLSEECIERSGSECVKMGCTGGVAICLEWDVSCSSGEWGSGCQYTCKKYGSNLAVGGCEADSCPGCNFNLTAKKVAGSTGTGTIVSKLQGTAADDGKINCGPACLTQTASYPKDEMIVLTATASIGSEFVVWNGCDSVAPDPVLGNCHVKMDKAKAVSARFNLAGVRVDGKCNLNVAKNNYTKNEVFPAGGAAPCSSGQPNKELTDSDLPHEDGERVFWRCLGSGPGNTDAPCEAKRLDCVPSPVCIKSPQNIGHCNDSICGYTGSAYCRNSCDLNESIACGSVSCVPVECPDDCTNSSRGWKEVVP